MPDRETAREETQNKVTPKADKSSYSQLVEDKAGGEAPSNLMRKISEQVASLPAITMLPHVTADMDVGP